MDKPIKSDCVGVIKVYYALKGYGFITRPAGKDVFFYRGAVANEAALVSGSTVHFEIETTSKGLRAKDIRRIG